MKHPALLLLLYIAAAFAGGALLAYPLHLLVGFFADVPFHRIVSRALMLSALLLLVPFLKLSGVNNRAVLGYGLPRRRFIECALKGWAIGLLTLAPLALLLLALGLRVPDPQQVRPARFADLLWLVAVSAPLIGFIEETYFRGALHSAAAMRLRAWIAIVLVSAFYAWVHFVHVAALAPGVRPDWLSGPAAIVEMFADYRLRELAGSFLTLVGVGMLLGFVRQHTGHIAWCVGLHAGWVCVIQGTRRFTVQAADHPLGYLVESYDGFIGWLAAAWVALLLVGYALARRMRTL